MFVFLLYVFMFVFAQGRHFEIKHERVMLKPSPVIEAQLFVAADMQVGKSYARAYFYDVLGKRIMGPVSPAASYFEKGQPPTALPFYLERGKGIKVRFPLPSGLTRNYPGWRAVLVFGDDKEATALLVAEEKKHITGEFATWYNFPENALCQKDSVTRLPAQARLTEMKCTTNLKDYPQFTLFARLPEGVANAREAKGVLCLSLLANQITNVRLMLMNNEATGDVGEMIRYADAKQLIVLCWAVKQFWNTGINSDELNAGEAKYHDGRFTEVANSWARGVRRLAGMYGFEPKNFMIWGYSNSAQFAGRLALKKPEFFGVVHMHNPAAFGTPTKEAKHIIWSMTMGENDGGYGNAMKFWKKCQSLGYRYFYKTVPMLGHGNDRGSRQWANLVFEYVRTLPADQRAREQKLKEDFENAAHYGDWMNQSVSKREDVGEIPLRLRVALPTPLLVKGWLREQPLTREEDPAEKKHEK
jgi:pimeloyl-ACP methyl ester carboxylesterase